MNADDLDTLPADAPPTGDKGGIRDITPGARIGRFVVIDRLGAGGMGVVLGAYDPTLDRRVALKLLHASMRGGSLQARERLLREARAMAKVEHPNVLKVHEVGELGDDVFIAMELVGGGTLRSWRKAASRTRQEILDVYLQAGRGLAAAHDAGLVHRDFKPENVLLTSDGSVRVADFGLVGGDDSSPGTPPVVSSISQITTKALTETGAIMGTPAYMAPEQHHGHRAVPASDQFAFCIALWEALFGERPFAGKQYAELVINVDAGAVVDPPAAASVPRRIEDALRRGLRPKIDERWPSMTALLDVIAGDPEAARARRARRWGLAVAGAVAAGVIGFAIARRTDSAGATCGGAAELVATSWNAERRAAVHTAFIATRRPYAEDTFTRVAAELDRYAAAWSAARTDACEDTRKRGVQSAQLMDLRMACLDRRRAELDGLVTVLASAPDVDALDHAVEAAVGLSSLEACADTTALVAAVPPAEPSKRAAVAALYARLDAAEQLEKLGKLADALRVGKELEEAAAPLAYPPLTADVLVFVASVQRRRLELDAAETAVLAAARAAADGKADSAAARAWMLLVEIRMRNSKLDDLETLQAVAEAAVARTGDARLSLQVQSAAGNLHHAKGRFEEARASFQHALDDARGVLPDDHIQRSELLNNLGRTVDAMGRYEEALSLYREALAIVEKTLGPDHLFVSTATNNVGAVLQAMGRYEEARAAHERALRIVEATLGPDHAEVAMTLKNLAGVLREQGHEETAVPLLQRALGIVEKSLGPDHLLVAESLLGLGSTLQAVGDLPGARAALTRALAIRERALGPEHIQVAYTLGALGNVELIEGRAREAQKVFGRGLAIVEKTVGPDHPDAALFLYSLGSIAENERRFDEAKRLYVRALAIEEKHLGVGHPETAYSRASLGDLLHTQHDYLHALDYYRQALAIWEKAHGPDHANLIDPLVSMSECHRALGDPAAALPLAERAAAIAQRHPGDSARLGAARFELAQALWADGRDRERARVLAAQARDDIAGAGETQATNVAEIARWLKARGGR